MLLGTIIANEIRRIITPSMKFLFLPAMLLVLICSCTQKPKHPQAAIINRNIPAAMTEQQILNFADSIHANQANFQKHSSLVYQRDGTSFNVEKFSSNGTAVLFKTLRDSAGMSRSNSDYYFNGDSLILIRENRRKNTQTGEVLEEKRTYLRNNIAFKTETRTGISASGLLQQRFTTTKQADQSNKTFKHIIDEINDAMSGSNEFALVFDNFISSPGEQYIVLKSSIPNGFSASISVGERDQFIDSLIADPLHFKDQKLSFRWIIKNREAVYVPVASKTTSANGLKR